jgi:hypothetical protein
VDGGPGYYGQFSNGLPTSADFFPIGVWGAYDFTATNVAKDKDVGLNLYVWNADTSASGQQNIAAAGMYTFQNVDDRANTGTHTRGWMLDDEADMQSGPGADTTNCTGAGYDVMRAQLAKVPDGRVTYANYGKGVFMWETDAQASCFVNRFQKITSLDMYWHTDPNEKSNPLYAKSASYGQTVDRARALDARDGQRHPIWNFVEVGWPWTEDPAGQPQGAISPAEIRAAVWHSIIAAARGIIYFQHSFGGPCQTHHALRQTGTACYGAVIDMVRSVNTQIRTLAPVLNAPTVTGSQTQDASIRTMTKWYGGHYYVFAAARQPSPGLVSWSMPCIGAATAVRLGEPGTLPLVAGVLTDTFADGNAVHIYRIDGGSSCGL